MFSLGKSSLLQIQTKNNSLNFLFSSIHLNQKIAFRRELINTLSSEVSQIKKTVENQQKRITSLETQLKELKEEYKKLIYKSYVNRNKYDKLIYIFAAEDFNQAYKDSNWQRPRFLDKVYTEKEKEYIFYKYIQRMV